MAETRALGNGYIFEDGDMFSGFVDTALGEDGNIVVVIYQDNNSEPKALITLSLKSAILLGRAISQEIQEHLNELKVMNEGTIHE